MIRLSSARRRMAAVVLAMAVAAVCPLPSVLAAPGDAPAAPAANLPRGWTHSETQTVRELVNQGLVPLIEAGRVQFRGTPEQALYDAAYITANWEAVAKQAEEKEKATKKYLEDLQTYLDSKPAYIDGGWALNQAKMLLGPISEPIITRIEYWGSSETDRKKLTPIVELGNQMLQISGNSLQSAMAQYERIKPMPEKAYMGVYNTTSELEYYKAWGLYFTVLAKGPDMAAKAKTDALKQAAELLGQWADGDDSSGVKYQSLLLRGKIRGEAGTVRDTKDAIRDLMDAGSEEKNDKGESKAPGWVQFQARYQTVVAKMKSKDFDGALSTLDDFKRWANTRPESNNDKARMALDMLKFRVEYARGEAENDSSKREAIQLKAMKIPAGWVEKDPTNAPLVYEQLSIVTSPEADPKTLLPLQALGLAWSKAQEKNYDKALKAALAVRDNKNSAESERLEATLIAGVSYTQQKRIGEAAKMNVEFVGARPKDPRSKDLLDIALSQLGTIRRDAGAQTPPEIVAATIKALDLATSQFGQKKWLYTYGVILLENGKADKAKAAFDQIPAEDPQYLDVRYQLVTLAVQNLKDQVEKKASESELRKAGFDLTDQCGKFLDMLDHPPKNAPADTLNRVQGYRYDVWLIQASTYLNPLKDGNRAVEVLERLNKVADQLPDAKKALLLRNRILAYQLAGKSDQAVKVVLSYAEQYPDKAEGIFGSMLVRLIDEMEAAQKSDPDKAKTLAGQALDLIDALIKYSKGKPNGGDKVYMYRQFRADTLARAGRVSEGKAEYLALQTEKPADLSNFVGEARCEFVGKNWAYAYELFVRIIPKLRPGSELFWESNLRMLQCEEQQGRPSEPIKAKLKNLRAIHGADKLGVSKAADGKPDGKSFKAEYDKMLQKYGLLD